MTLRDFLPPISNPVELRLAKEYGAIMATLAIPPPVIVFSGHQEVVEFQSSLPISRRKIGSFEMELQAQAMEALVAACDDAARLGSAISARCSDSGRRSYQETVDLWLRNVERGLEHWLAEHRISAERAASIRQVDMGKQIEIILTLEDVEQLYFSTYFDKSILASVAAPGASQHLSLLAFDMAEFKDDRSEHAMRRNGWFRTVVGDVPHFTYLGRQESELPGIGLKEVVRMYDGAVYRFWTPEV